MAARSGRGRGLHFWALALVAATWAGPVLAQSAESQAAEALFRQARQLLDDGELEQACEKFAASQALEPGLGTLLYLGDCYERAGRFASALTTFREAAALAEERGDDTRLRLAQVRISALDPRTPKLEIRRGAAAIEDLQVTVGGVPVAPAELGRPVPRDAGSYEVRFSAPGHEPFVSHIELRNAGHVLVTVPRLVPLRGAAAPAPKSAPADPSDGSSQRAAAWVIGGTGAALLVTAGVFAGLAASKNRDSKAACDAGDPNRCGPAGVELRNDAKSFATVATVATALGSAALAGGLLVYVAAPDTEDPLGQAALVGVQGSF